MRVLPFLALILFAPACSAAFPLTEVIRNTPLPDVDVICDRSLNPRLPEECSGRAVFCLLEDGRLLELCGMGPGEMAAMIDEP